MNLRKRCLLLVSVAALAGTVACSAAPPPAAQTTHATTSGLVFRAPASSASKAKLGITRWHTIMEPKSSSFVIDGQDAKGNVKFIAAGTGGGDFAAGICRRVAISKTTAVRACTHY